MLTDIASQNQSTCRSKNFVSPPSAAKVFSPTPNKPLTMEKIRVDKWLWCVRIFKSRTISIEACKAGKVRINGIPVKPSYLVSPGETIEVRKNGFSFQFKVVQLLKSRASAPVAQACYLNLTSEEELNKYNDWHVGKGSAERRERGAGRPTKLERRQIDEFKSGDWDWAMDWEDPD